MDKKTYFWITLLGGWFGLHKFMTGKIGAGILYLLTCGIFLFGWVGDTISASQKAFGKNNGKNSGKSKSAYIDSLYADANIQYQNSVSMRPYVEKYYKGMEEIETMWSVLFNLKVTSGEQVDIFIEKCYNNISDLQTMLQAQRSYGIQGGMPPHVPAYVRLAMLYEKQENYQDAIDICVTAIKAGAINDGNKGKMYGRLARLIRKSGIEVNEDILKLANNS